MIQWIIQALAGPILAYLGKRTDADLEKFKAGVAGDTTVGVEELRTRIELAKLGNARVNSDRESWWTAWMVPVAFGLFILHVAGIVLDSMPLLGHEVGTWSIAKLPSPYDSMQQAIVLTVCGVAGASAIKRIFGK